MSQSLFPSAQTKHWAVFLARAEHLVGTKLEHFEHKLLNGSLFAQWGSFAPFCLWY